MENNNGIVEVDEELFGMVSRNFELASNELTEASSKIIEGTNFLSGELSSFSFDGLLEKITAVNEKIIELLAKTEGALQAYRMIDEESAMYLSTFDPFVEKLFDQEIENANGKLYEEMTLEERLEYLDELVGNYKEVLDEIKEEFNQLYEDGIPISVDSFLQLDNIFNAFGLYNAAGFSSQIDFLGNYQGRDGQYFLEPEQLLQMVQYCNETGVLQRINDYLQGASWEEAKLDELYKENTNMWYTFNENYVINRVNYLLMEDRITDGASLREYLQEESGDFLKIYMEEMQNPISIYCEKKQDITILSNQIYNMEQAKGLMPYYYIMVSEEGYLSYLENDYSNYTKIDSDYLKVLSQEEVALYDYLYHESPEKAESYLEAMEDTINMRTGYQKAAEYIEWLGENGYEMGLDELNSFFEGGKDGVQTFFEGIGNFFAPDGKRSAFDYEKMYKVQLLCQISSEEGLNVGDWFTEAERARLNWTYQTGSSVGNMLLPSLAGFIPVVGEALASGLMGISIAGNATEESLQEGHSLLDARIYGLLTGLSETTTERLLGGIPGVSNLGKSCFGNMAREAGEEFTQTYMDAIIRNLVHDENIDLCSEELFMEGLHSAGHAFISSGILQGFSGSAGHVLNLGVSAVTGGKTNYTNIYNQVESAFHSKILEGVKTRYLNGEAGSTALLNMAVHNVSAVELSEMMDTLTVEQQNAIKAGMDFQSRNLLTFAEMINNINNSDSSSLLEVPGVNLDSLRETVTRDGRTLMEYVLDTKMGLVTSETIEEVGRFDAKMAEQMEAIVTGRNQVLASFLQSSLESFRRVTLQNDTLLEESSGETESEQTSIFSRMNQMFKDKIPILQEVLNSVIGRTQALEAAHENTVNENIENMEGVEHVHFIELADNDSQTLQNMSEHAIASIDKMQMISELRNFLSQSGSNPKAVDAYLKAFESTNTEEAANILKTLLQVIVTPGPTFNLSTNDKEWSGCYHDENRIQILGSHLDKNIVLFHEIGHFLFNHVLGDLTTEVRRIQNTHSIIPNIDDIFARARLQARVDDKINTILSEQFYQIQQIREQIAERVRNQERPMQRYLKEWISKYGKHLPVIYEKFSLEAEIERQLNDYIYNHTYLVEFQDIVTAVFLGEPFDKHSVSYGHGQQYYAENNANPIHEIIANYTSAKAMNKTEFFDKLQELFGEEFCDTIDSIYQQIVSYGNGQVATISLEDINQCSIAELVEKISHLTLMEQNYIFDHLYNQLNGELQIKLTKVIRIIEIMRGNINVLTSCSSEGIYSLLEESITNNGKTLKDYLRENNPSFLENILEYARNMAQGK